MRVYEISFEYGGTTLPWYVCYFKGKKNIKHTHTQNQSQSYLRPITNWDAVSEQCYSKHAKFLGRNWKLHLFQRQIVRTT